MPVRSLSSPVFKWPDQRTVAEAVAAWARREAGRHSDVVAIGYFGSYATGTWGVGSDVDLIAIVRRADEPFETRAVSWNTTDLPVPAQLLGYTVLEWQHLVSRGNRFSRVLTSKVVWVIGSSHTVHQLMTNS